MSLDDENKETPLRPEPDAGHRLFWGLQWIGFLVCLGVVFLPWDAPMPEAPDLESPPLAVPEAENASFCFEEARALLSANYPPLCVDAADYSWGWSDLASNGGPWDPILADQVLSDNGPSLAALEKGLACGHYVSRSQRELCLNPSLGQLTGFRALAQLLCLKSRRAQLSGDYAGAAAAALQGLSFGERVGDGSIREWLSGNSVQGLALARLEDLASDVRTPEPVLREILAALDQRTPEVGAQRFRRSLQHEYRLKKARILAGKNPVGEYCASNSLEDTLARGLRYLWKPRATLQMEIPLYRAIAVAAGKPLSQADWNYDGKSKRSPALLRALRPNFLGHEELFWLAGSVRSYLSSRCHLQAWIEAVRLKVALRLYEREHGGLPSDLTALVPGFLPAVPADPYDGQPFRYSQAGMKVWSIGADLVDQGGSAVRPDALMTNAQGFDLVLPVGVRDMAPKPLPPPAAAGSVPKGSSI